MVRDARPGLAPAKKRGPPRGQGVFLVVGVLARAIKNILLHRTGENSCCGVHASRGAGLRRPLLGRRPPLAARQDLADAGICRRSDSPPMGLANAGTRRRRDSPTKELADNGTRRRRSSPPPGLGVTGTPHSNDSHPLELLAIDTRRHLDLQLPDCRRRHSSRQGLGTFGTPLPWHFRDSVQ